MAFRNSSGTNEIPRLVVKIVGGKQVKYFIEEPERQREDQIQDSGPDVVDERMKEGPVQQTLQPHSRLPGFQAKLGIVPHGALDMARDRLCFTAPSGDRTFSYIHQRNRLERTDSKATAGVADITEQGDLSEEGQEEDWLCLAIREELCDWPASSLRGIEEKLVALDPSLRGTLKQSQIVDVFLNKEVPLKLPSFHLLLKAFSDVHDPDKVHYKGILRFIQRVVFPQELQECSQSEAGHVSHSPPVHRDSVSVCSPDSINNAETNTWLQRFQRLERAMHLSDRNNTGYMDKDMAKRLLQNYNLILDLNLSSLRINEVTCGAKSQRKVHLDSALHYLKQL